MKVSNSRDSSAFRDGLNTFQDPVFKNTKLLTSDQKRIHKNIPFPRLLSYSKRDKIQEPVKVLL
jgi:hypothetical protein